MLSVVALFGNCLSFVVRTVQCVIANMRSILLLVAALAGAGRNGILSGEHGIRTGCASVIPGARSQTASHAFAVPQQLFVANATPALRATPAPRPHPETYNKFFLLIMPVYSWDR